MSFRKILISCIVLVGCLEVLASPVDFGRFSPRSGYPSTRMITSTSESHDSGDDSAMSGLERRGDDRSSAGFIIIPKSDPLFSKLSSEQSSSAELYALVFKGRSFFIKEGDKVFYKVPPRSLTHQIKDLSISVKIRLPQNPKTLDTKDQATLTNLKRVVQGDHGCTWLMEALEYLTKASQEKGMEVGLSEAEEESTRNLITSKEKALMIAPSCGKKIRRPVTALNSPVQHTIVESPIELGVNQHEYFPPEFSQALSRSLESPAKLHPK
ncbi:hypothetical protein EV368DRAFT_65803 [Lentinula lateritia]|uniref:Uncharacterized protein n=1 Tax=Lentinula aff. lateritia TaxID=2804960 RepID=A0ACC1TM58_9AGAR|nr:hypothetical protein F5876DRAFT_81770 [Lentinula aff. lateritia]KAJ3851395.1 hypothetical protein EV368DRAFT_65803 [Lentinula lateritia]